MFKWIWNMQSIDILLSHNVCLPLKPKLGFNGKLIGLFQKKVSGWIGLGLNPYWDGPNNSSKMYLYCNPNIFKLGVQKVSFKLQNWYKKKPKITSQIKTQVAEQTFIYLFINYYYYYKGWWLDHIFFFFFFANYH